MQSRLTFDPHNEIGDIVMVPTIFEIRDRKIETGVLDPRFRTLVGVDYRSRPIAPI